MYFSSAYKCKYIINGIHIDNSEKEHKKKGLSQQISFSYAGNLDHEKKEKLENDFDEKRKKEMKENKEGVIESKVTYAELKEHSHLKNPLNIHLNKTLDVEENTQKLKKLNEELEKEYASMYTNINDNNRNMSNLYSSIINQNKEEMKMQPPNETSNSKDPYYNYVQREIQKIEKEQTEERSEDELKHLENNSSMLLEEIHEALESVRNIDEKSEKLKDIKKQLLNDITLLNQTLNEEIKNIKEIKRLQEAQNKIFSENWLYIYPSSTSPDEIKKI